MARSASRISPDAPEALARSRYTRISATKVRQVVDLIRGRHVDDARRVLRFTQKAACEPVAKVLESAIANAEHNYGLATDELVVARAWVDEGPTLRRFRPRALGRATRIRKRTSHVSIVVARPEELVAAPPAGRSAAGARTATGSKTTAKTTTTRRGAASESETSEDTDKGES